ncbi:NAD(P)H-binding protein [Streptomyces sp. NPDC047072]|uniref:NAD(P)-dependent oxidoreductase n=1 Tax=Streptomyces sp. NPDC047072 TaxID=3154809 RepID=UPI0033EB56D5
MKLVVFGANGPTGRQVTRQALTEGHTVTAITRRPGSFPLSDPRLRVTGADVLDPDAVARVVAGQDAVISTLGASKGESPVRVYSRSAAHITRAMAEHGGPAFRGRDLGHPLRSGGTRRKPPLQTYAPSSTYAPRKACRASSTSCGRRRWAAGSEAMRSARPSVSNALGAS